ncbi:PREDICTED: patellin-1-like [Tarenaya hassleriana]|uniref:patellin-1-like n=1 Tax=Tarenaya hassleriana TaxID=28532 RepID=UPI00053C6505|nr:PREDICTED: patellin-1-like [Tarenaya hassleriana]
MAQEETQKPAAAATSEQGGPAPSPTPPPQPPPPNEEALVIQKEVSAPAPVEKPVADKAVDSPVPEAEKPAVVTAEEGTATVEAEKRIVHSDSFKEESYVASELPEPQRKALEEFKELVREALNKREFTAPAKEEEKKIEEETKEEEKKEVTLAPAETKPEEKPFAPVTTDTKKEENSAVPVEEEKPAAPAPAPAETKPDEEQQATPAAAVTKAEEDKPAESSTITIEKAFAADEDGAKTVEAIEETIVSVSAPETTAPATADEASAAEEPVEPEEVLVWGVPLLQDERSDVVLLKFLRARDFKVKEAFTMLKNTVRWRKENNIDELVGEDLGGSDFEKIVFAHGVDKQGHVVIYSAYSEFQNKELFSDKEKLNKFLKWRIQFQEKCVRALDFSPAAKSSFVFVSDFRNAPGLGKRALWQFIRRAVKLFEDNYPEFSAKELFINVPWWYIPYYRTFGSIITSPRTKSKMFLAGPSKSPDTIFKHIAPEQVPVKYGGLSKESHSESLFATEETVTEAIVKPAAKYSIDLPASEACTISWELRVLGSDVSYGAQFEPSTEGSYTVIVSKNRKMGLTDEPVMTDAFKVGEPGKVVITIDNQSSKKKKLLYRFKTQPRSD